jgi:hypothetical protein
LHIDELLKSVEKTGENRGRYCSSTSKKWVHACRKDIKNLINNSAKLQNIIEIHDAATKEQIVLDLLYFA